MKKCTYKITIFNSGGYDIYTLIVEAENENKAIIKALDDAILNDGDTIKIEEVEG